MLRPDNIDELIVAVEGKFDCTMGPPMAYFEWEDAQRNLKRAVYQVMALAFIVQGQDVKERDLTQKLIHLAWKTFEKIASAGATRIVWRNGRRILLEREHSCHHEGDMVRVYARFAALKPNDEQVNVPEFYKDDNCPTIIVSREMLEDVG